MVAFASAVTTTAAPVVDVVVVVTAAAVAAAVVEDEAMVGASGTSYTSDRGSDPYKFWKPSPQDSNPCAGICRPPLLHCGCQYLGMISPLSNRLARFRLWPPIPLLPLGSPLFLYEFCEETRKTGSK